MGLHHVESVMGTTISMDVVDAVDHALIDELVAWFHHVDEVFSPYKELSTITRIGRGEVGPEDPALTGEVVEVLERCESLIGETDGVFDVWSLPSPNGTRFDPCGYVKGWSVERARDLLAARGSQHFCINAGGDVALGGRNPLGEPWQVGIRHPEDRDALALVLAAEGPLGIATSGSYERGAHIHDPRVDLPVTELASVTIVGPSLAEADAFATTVYVMGVRGLAWLSRYAGYSGCAVTHDGELFSTDDFDRYVVR
jgi:thiamine biosynthesis lipoprotein